MKITLITACYNGVSVIRTALESVLRQTWPEIEYLVIDGGSADGTVDLIREYEPKFQGRMRWLSESDRGMYDAINKGIRMATGELVGILNADDVLSTEHVIEKVVCAFGQASRGDAEKDFVCEAEWRKSKETAPLATLTNPPPTLLLDAVYGDIRFVANRTDVGLDELRAERTVRYYSSRHWRSWMLQWGFMPPHPSVYIRKACFDQLGEYALDYKIAADYALLVRFLRKARLRSKYLPMCFVDMRTGGMSTKNWRSNLLLNQEIVRGNREAGYFCCLPMLLPKYAFKVFEFVLPRLRNVCSRKAVKAQRGE